MPSSASGDPRYVKRRAARLPDMVVDGVSLGPAMRPQDLLVELRHIMELDEREIVDAFRAAGRRNLAEMFPELDEAEIGEMVESTVATTASRVTAWRRRNREMTWLELRVLLVGLKS